MVCAHDIDDSLRGSRHAVADPGHLGRGSGSDEMRDLGRDLEQLPRQPHGARSQGPQPQGARPQSPQPQSPWFRDTQPQGTQPHDTQSHGDHKNDEQHHHHSHDASSAHPGQHHLLTVENLSVSFRMYDPGEPYLAARQREVNVIDNLSVSVHVGEIVAVVGASGSGKTLLADSILGLFEPNALVSGHIWFDGDEMDACELARLRGHGISLVPQSVRHLDPLMKVGRQVEGFARRRDGVNAGGKARGKAKGGAGGKARGEARANAKVTRERLFARYDLDPAVADMYPFQLSGGMARRILLCCALMDDPRLIIADEPTPGLDLPLAVRAMDDFRAFADDGGGVLLITHDIELALRVANRIAVFKDGTVVEETAVANFASPDLLRSEFARELWHALPEHGFETPASDQPDTGQGDAGKGDVASDGIEGAAASALHRPDAGHADMGRDDPDQPAHARLGSTSDRLEAPLGVGSAGDDGC